MGYSTRFEGSVSVTPPLNRHERTYLRKFAGTRRTDRTRGPYFVGGSNIHGRGDDSDVLDQDRPPAGQPSLWCGWIPARDGSALAWDGIEKFHDADVWMRYLIDHFLRPGAHAQGRNGFGRFTFDHVIDGTIHAQGEDPDDIWDLIVTNNAVRVTYAET
ncbi:hypothetical protein [Nocardia sp. BMG111209]|uniref:hypothetical protein n=1 Tax=Nocardia sp. BMG111209 TaxID=1160137 RepID=UPI0003759857|nr:hypothetical protein [Nocardia sp. BMG111209]